MQLFKWWKANNHMAEKGQLYYLVWPVLQRFWSFTQLYASYKEAMWEHTLAYFQFEIDWKCLTEALCSRAQRKNENYSPKIWFSE